MGCIISSGGKGSRTDVDKHHTVNFSSWLQSRTQFVVVCGKLLFYHRIRLGPLFTHENEHNSFHPEQNFMIRNSKKIKRNI